MEELQDRAEAFIRFGERAAATKEWLNDMLQQLYDQGHDIVAYGVEHSVFLNYILDSRPRTSSSLRSTTARRSPRSAPERRLLSEVFTISPITVPHGHSRLCSWDRAGGPAPRSPYWLR